MQFINPTTAINYYGSQISVAVTANNTGLYCATNGVTCQNDMITSFQGTGGDNTVSRGDAYMVYVRYVYNTTVGVGAVNTTNSASFYPFVDQYAILNVPGSNSFIFNN